MNYFDYWEYDTIDFLKRFIEAELDCLSVNDFLKRFELEHYELSIDLKEAKRILLVYGDSEYSFSSTDLSWISDRTKVLVYSFEDRNLIFVDLDSSRDTYYLNSAAFIKIFNKAFPNNNCYVFKTCGGLAVGSMKSFNSNSDSNFCVTQLFVEESLPTAAEFFDELLFDKYEAIPSTIINYSPQERFEYVKPHKHDSEWDCFEEQISFDCPEDPIIYATYKEACDVLKNIVNEGDISSLDVLEEVLLSEEKVLSAPIGFEGSDGEPLAFEDEDTYSADAYADAEQMLKEMLKNNN